MKKEINRLAATLFAILVLLTPVWVFDTVLASEASDLAQDLTNPLADLMTFFLAPKTATNSGLLWGVGPVCILPTATDSLLGSEKWSAGPSAVVLTMKGPWTIGTLANHVWSFAGDSDRADVNASLVQPFVSYTWPNAWSMSVQTESVYDWETEDWSVPVNLSVSRLVMFGKLPVSFQAGIGYWMTTPDSGPEGWRFRLQVNFVLPTLFGKK